MSCFVERPNGSQDVTWTNTAMEHTNIHRLSMCGDMALEKIGLMKRHMD